MITGLTPRVLKVGDVSVVEIGCLLSFECCFFVKRALTLFCCWLLFYNVVVLLDVWQHQDVKGWVGKEQVNSVNHRKTEKA